MVSVAGDAHADLFELKWSSEGYLRSRTMLLTNLAAEDRSTIIYPPTGDELVLPEIRRTSYVTSRLRLMPTLSYEKLAKLNLQIDALDDVLWGDNNAKSSAPLLATDVTDQYYLGGEVGDSVTVPRAWMEFQIPVGIMRIGRMPSHWGIGLLANGGGTQNFDPMAPEYEQRKSLDTFFDDDFGDNHFGSTADRILFITTPITIAKTIAKSKQKESNFITGYAFGKISEAPLYTAEPLERRFRPFGQQGFLSRGGSDDVNEHVLIAVYNNADWDKVRFTDEIRVGTYMVFRRAKETSTNPSALDPAENSCGEGGVPCVDTGASVWIADLWWRFRYGPYYTEGEYYRIGGESFGGIPFPAKNELKKAEIDGGVARFGYLTDPWDALLEVGHASGDDSLEDTTFRQRALHPDYNVSLILFEEIIREASARAFGPPFFSDENPEGAKGLMSSGGVINANYVLPKGRYRLPVGGLSLVGQVLLAWLDKKPTTGASIYPYADQLDGTFLGTEIDLALKTSFAGDHIDFSLETGYLKFGEVLEKMFPNADSSFTLQSRIAFIW
jgi:hypothetical protein